MPARRHVSVQIEGTACCDQDAVRKFAQASLILARAARRLDGDLCQPLRYERIVPLGSLCVRDMYDALRSVIRPARSLMSQLKGKIDRLFAEEEGGEILGATAVALAQKNG